MTVYDNIKTEEGFTIEELPLTVMYHLENTPAIREWVAISNDSRELIHEELRKQSALWLEPAKRSTYGDLKNTFKKSVCEGLLEFKAGGITLRGIRIGY